MGKGMEPQKGYNQKKYLKGYDKIDWTKTPKGKIKTNDKGLTIRKKG